MSKQLVLSLFPGIGLLDRAFEEEGFCVVRGPDLLWGGDIRSFHPPAGKFDGVIGGPPCQIFSRMRHIQPLAGQKHGNLIPEFERIVRLAWPLWFVMENVPEAPAPAASESYELHSELVRDVWCGGETTRMRRFTFGSRATAKRFRIETLALHRTDAAQAALAGGARRVPVALGGSGKIKSSRRVCAGDQKTVAGLAAALQSQGLPSDFLADAPFTVAGKIKAVGNGVPLPMGLAVARAVKRAINPPELIGRAILAAEART
jgi:DNA (cytosine-5)-methyltransferase 1